MMTNKRSVDQTERDIRRGTRKKYSAEEKIRIVLEGLRDDVQIASILITLRCTLITLEGLISYK